MKVITKKRKGNVADLIGTAICLLFLLVVVLSSVHFYKILEVKREISVITRGYSLLLEEHGELTTTEVTEMKNRISALSDSGFSNITVTYNDTNTKRNHGQEVSLLVEVVATRKELGLSKVYDYIKDSYTFKERLYSTSKE